MPLVQRLGKNVGSYKGRGSMSPNVLREMEQAIEGKNWIRDEGFLALRRPLPSPRRRVYISAGIHGDEPAGPLAMLQDCSTRTLAQ